MQTFSPSLCGVFAATGAFLFWGFLPIFWKALESVDSFEILCQRVVWSFVSMLPFLFLKGRLALLADIFRTPKKFACLAASGALIVGNWYLYIWAVNHGMVLETSLGYFINPLMSIVLGVIVFKENISRIVWFAIALAAAGVLFQVVTLGHLPLVPLGLAVSFAAYTLIRKLLPVDAVTGLIVETLVALPFAAGWLLWQGNLGNGAFLQGDAFVIFLLVCSGLITSVPLLAFTYSARRVRLTTLGLLQYLSPSTAFLLGIFLYSEPFSFNRLVTFACIWGALALYTREMLKVRRW